MKSSIGRARAAADAAEDDGFTLIELLVVLLIIGILLAIAIPTFLSVTKGANNTAAQSNLQTALTGADTFFTNNDQTFAGIYGGSGVSTITSIDTGLSWVQNGPSTGSNVISMHVLNSATPVGSVIELTAFSPGSNDCWGILEVKATQGSGSNASVLFGASQTGSYYFIMEKGQATTTNCDASSTQDLGAVSRTGFPTG